MHAETVRQPELLHTIAIMGAKFRASTTLCCASLATRFDGLRWAGALLNFLGLAARRCW